MAWSHYQKILALLMVATGSINTLATKWADMIESENSVGKVVVFNHPFLQAAGMFLGELSCLIVFHISVCWDRRKNPPTTNDIGSQKFNPIVFLIPALCDMTATSIMYVGLGLTYASSFQMLRGAVIVFTGLLSVAFLNRQLKKLEWIGIGIVIVGLACVGMADIFYPSKTGQTFGRNSLITGDLLIIMAQIIAATQMVVEEKFVSKYNVPPLQGVGWEGLFGFVVLSILLVPMYYIKVGNMIFKNPGGQLEDAIDGFIQIGNNWQLTLAFLGTIVSIAFFNFAGLSVTKEMSATTRMVLDSVRTFVIWIVSLALKWQDFNWLQLVGFIILLCGMCLYNDVILRPLYTKIKNWMNSGATQQPLFRSSDEDVGGILAASNQSINA